MSTTIDSSITEDLGAKTARPRKFEGLGRGLTFERYFSREGVHPFDEVEWERRDAIIGNERGENVFEQRGVEFPVFWSQTATNVVVSKYFRGHIGSPDREFSLRQLISRVADTITGWGLKQNFFATTQDSAVFNAELTSLMLHQRMAFNSPVWFNVGVEKKPQASACFINAVEDTMESILTLAKTEGMLFKWGSGTGTNLSSIRSSREFLAGGGTASGPVSFMKGYDAFAGVIKSGGKTRRAAKMVILNVEHPDIMDFVRSKATEERKAWALIDAGYDGGFNVPGGAYDSVFFQNANHSVRVTDGFMKAVEGGGSWTTKAVKDGAPVDTYEARDVMREIADSAWICGDPGMQYDTTINEWHTCPNTAPINASNPCSEYMFLDNSACNLASLNLRRFQNNNNEFEIESFRRAIQLTITAQELIVDNAGYPTPAIEKNSHAFRPLGLGFANLGAMLMSLGLPYDSDEGRALAGAITGIMCGEAYAQSARIAEQVGPFTGYPINEKPMLNVIQKHQAAAESIAREWPVFESHALVDAAKESWATALELGKKAGFRNSQVTVLAPTGTIGFMMDCDTTGVEPDIALIKYKKLVGGGYFKIVNQTVPEALTRLGYTDEARKEIIDYLTTHDTIEGAPGLKDEHLPVFDCAFKPAQGHRSIVPMGHVRMMGACQPFLSGAISKTVNMPTHSSVEDIAEIYMEAWRLGLKAIAIYRDGCKRTQPLSTSMDKGTAKTDTQVVEQMVAQAVAPEQFERRRRLPDERPSITHKFSIAGHEGYITVGCFEDGQPGEIFITMSKEGSVVSGLMDAFATSTSLCLQYGVPLNVLVDKFAHTRFEPSGFTNNPRIRIAKSVTDYIFRWLADKFLGEDAKGVYMNTQGSPWRPGEALETEEAEVQTSKSKVTQTVEVQTSVVEEKSVFVKARVGEVVYQANNNVFTLQADAPPCHVCGTIMIRSGACYKCTNCGATSGCS